MTFFYEVEVSGLRTRCFNGIELDRLIAHLLEQNSVPAKQINVAVKPK